MTLWKIASPVSLLMVLTSTPATAIPLQCHRDQATDRMMCAAPSEVRERSGIRSAPLYMGGPNNMRKTPYSVHVNCGTGVTHLKDSDGVSFAGGAGDETRAVRYLREIICEAPVKGAKK